MTHEIQFNGRTFAVRHNPESVHEVLRLYRSGKTVREAAEVAGIPHWTAMRYVRLAGLTRSRSRRLLVRYNHPDTDEGRSRRRLARRVWKLRGEGLTTYQIADRVGITQRGVCDYLRMAHDPFSFEDRMDRTPAMWTAHGMEDCWAYAVEAACEVVNVSADRLLSTSRGAKAVEARRLAAWALCEVFGMPICEAARRLGRNHASIANLLGTPIPFKTARQIERFIRSRIESRRRAA